MNGKAIMTNTRRRISAWRTSSYTNYNGNCVEVYRTLDRVQDTKNRGPRLCVDLTPLVAAVKAGRLTRS